MKEKMIPGGILPHGAINWQCPCNGEPFAEGFWPCNENGEFGALVPCPMHQLERCQDCGRLFNCHTGEILRQPKETGRVFIAPDFTDYEYPIDGGRKLPIYKEYTIDVRLWQFRKMEDGKLPEYISFDSQEGEDLLTELLDVLPNDHILRDEYLEGYLRRN